jgi:peroxiredoxin Q/BCP
MLKEGEQFPDFDLADQSGARVRLAELLGAPFLIYFYPKDDTSGCTKEACGFRDAMPDLPIPVLGVSPDSVESHQRFASKYGLNFRLLADTERSLIEACGLWVEKSMYGRKYMGVNRSTFLVGKDGAVLKAWHKVNPASHAQEVLEAVHEILH